MAEMSCPQYTPNELGITEQGKLKDVVSSQGQKKEEKGQEEEDQEERAAAFRQGTISPQTYAPKP